MFEKARDFAEDTFGKVEDKVEDTVGDVKDQSTGGSDEDQ